MIRTIGAARIHAIVRRSKGHAQGVIQTAKLSPRD